MARLKNNYRTKQNKSGGRTGVSLKSGSSDAGKKNSSKKNNKSNRKKHQKSIPEAENITAVMSSFP